MHERTSNLRVSPLSGEASNLLAAIPANLDLGAKGSGSLDTAMAETSTEASLDRFRRHSDRSYILEWTGDRSPVGADVGGYIIKHTQHGVVRDENDQDIGTYERMVDGAGVKASDHKMLVMLFAPKKE